MVFGTNETGVDEVGNDSLPSVTESDGEDTLLDVLSILELSVDVKLSENDLLSRTVWCIVIPAVGVSAKDPLLSLA